jgi:uncharacterized protein (TIGR04141 family)
MPGMPDKTAKFPELDIEQQYYYFLDRANIDLSIENIKRHQIVSHDMNTGHDVYSQKVYQCLYMDTTLDSKRYFLENGTWYKVDDKYHKQLESEVKAAISSSRIISFVYDKLKISQEAKKLGKHKEYIFNRDFTKELQKSMKAELLDTKLTNRIEVCDVLCLYSDSKVLFHNKYKYGSSALSHLFSQGYVAAMSISDEEFRKKANKKITTKELKFEEDNTFDRSKHTVLYGIISKKNKSGDFILPLFSMINLNMFIKNINTIGYKPEIAFIEVL